MTDQYISFLPEDRPIRIAVVDTSLSAKTMQQIHQSNALAAQVSSELMVAAALDVALAKNDQRSLFKIDGGHYFSMLSIEATTLGTIRGMVHTSDYNPQGQNVSQIISDALGPALMQSIRKTSEDETSQSTTALQHGAIAKDIAHHYVQSAQIPTAVGIDVVVTDGELASARGVLVQIIAEQAQASEQSYIEAFEQRLKASVSAGLADQPLPAVAAYIADVPSEQLHIARSGEMVWHCGCSFDSYLSKVALLPLDDRQELAQTGGATVVCDYCKRSYQYSAKDLLPEKKAARRPPRIQSMQESEVEACAHRNTGTEQTNTAWKRTHTDINTWSEFRKKAHGIALKEWLALVEVPFCTNWEPD